MVSSFGMYIPNFGMHVSNFGMYVPNFEMEKSHRKENFFLVSCFTHSYSVRKSSNPGLTPNPSPRRGEPKNREKSLRFTVYGLPFQILMLRIEPATPWQSPNKLGLCAWLKRSLQVMWFPLTSYILPLTSYLLHHTSYILPLTSYILHHTSLGFSGFC